MSGEVTFGASMMYWNARGSAADVVGALERLTGGLVGAKSRKA